jgi:hypothetical protein
MELTRTPAMLQQLLIATGLILPCTILLLALDQLPFLTQQLDRGQTIGRDAYNFWMAGKLAFEGNAALIYDNAAFMTSVRGTLGPEAGLHVFPYPPPALLFFAMFGWMPYWLALLLWSGAGLAAFTLATSSWRADYRLLVLALIAPLSLANIFLGQNGLLSAALFIAGLRLAHSRPIVAGIVIGCLAYKPTLAILLPLALLLERRWLCMASASASVVMLCALPTLIWGTEIWHSYLQLAVPFQQLLLEQGTGLAQFMKLTAFMSMHLLGFDNSSAYQLQAGFMLAALGLMVAYSLQRRVRGRFSGLDISILAVATFIILPYAHFYDMTLIAGGLLIMCKDNSVSDSALIIRSKVFGLLWALPILGLIFNIIGLPIAPVILLVGLALLCRAPIIERLI